MSETENDPAGQAGSPGAARVDPAGEELQAGGRDPEMLRNIMMFLPRLIVLVGKLLVDPEVSGVDKLLLGAVVVYIASPLDILPDFIPVIGQLDDIYLIALGLLRLLNRSGEAKLRQHWDGPEDIVAMLHTVTNAATRYLPQPVRDAVRRWVEVRSDDVPPGAL